MSAAPTVKSKGVVNETKKAKRNSRSEEGSVGAPADCFRDKLQYVLVKKYPRKNGTAVQAASIIADSKKSWIDWELESTSMPSAYQHTIPTMTRM